MGNLYINRTCTRAVVGAHPFGASAYGRLLLSPYCTKNAPKAGNAEAFPALFTTFENAYISPL